jgi:hypothetical protein
MTSTEQTSPDPKVGKLIIKFDKDVDVHEAQALIALSVQEARIDENEQRRITWMKYPNGFTFDGSPETFKRIWNSNIEDRIATLTNNKKGTE